MRRLGVLLGLGLAGCGLSASTRATLKQPNGYTFASPPPAELIQHVSDKGGAKWATEGMLGIAINSETGRVDAASTLGIDDPARALAAQVESRLKERGYGEPPRYPTPLRFKRDPPELSTETVNAMTTPYLLHLQVAVTAEEGHPTGFDATLVLFEKSGLMHYRSRCSIHRDTDAPPIAHQQLWESFERRCADELLKEF